MTDTDCCNMDCPNRIKDFDYCCSADESAKNKGVVPALPGTVDHWTAKNCPKYITDRRGK